MPALRIGIDAHVVTGKHQGTRTTLTALLRALARIDSRCEIMVYADDPAAARAMIGPGSLRYTALGRGGPVRRLLFEFPRLFRRDRIDVGIFQYHAPLFGRARRIVFVHDILPVTHPRYFPWHMRLRQRLLGALTILRAAHVVTVSGYSRANLIELYGLPPAKVGVLPNGPSFDPAVYAVLRTPAPARYILAVGRIEPRKNIPLLVEAFRMASVPGLRLVIVGTADMGDRYRLPDEPSIEHLRDVSDAALIDLYRGASLFVYPSAAEGFGIPLLDALLFGVPVVASNRTAMPEIAGGIAQMFDPEAPGAAAVLAALIAGHFAGAPVPAATREQRYMLGVRFNWDAAAAGLLAIAASLGRGEAPCRD